mmetsp:Transcript_23405/g.56011  ORF Transcript_23405/g.56011 Transcript_23405/m.56011 type:complete len:255 (+) Transcript_23405:748-1512(+)
MRPPPASSSDKMYQKLKVISATSRSGCAAPRSTALTTGSACCGSRRMRCRYCSPVSVKMRQRARQVSSSSCRRLSSYMGTNCSTCGTMTPMSCWCSSWSCEKCTASTSTSVAHSKSSGEAIDAKASAMMGDAASWSEGSHALRSQLERQRSWRFMMTSCPRHCSHTCSSSCSTCCPAALSISRKACRRRGMMPTLKFSTSSGSTVRSSSKHGSLTAACSGGVVRLLIRSGTTVSHDSMCRASRATARQSWVSTG